MQYDRDRIARAHAARLDAARDEHDAIIAALRNRSVPQAEIARITGMSTEAVRQLRLEAGILPDERKVRGGGPGLIYAFRDEDGRWWPKGTRTGSLTAITRSGSRSRLSPTGRAALPGRHSLSCTP